MANLFSPLTLRSLTLPNRIGVAPMCQYSAQEGLATDWHLVHYGGLAQGGAGLVILEATAVQPEGRISPQDLGLWSDAQIAPLARVADFIRSQGAIPAIQLAHAGRKAGTSAPWRGGGPLPSPEAWATVAPSALAFAEDHPVPAALDSTGLSEVIHAFTAAARRALAAGFQAIEVHAAHGYLLHQFLSPLSNQRLDGYGGDFRGRTRLLREVVEALRQVIPQTLPLLVRLSVTDWVEGGWDLDQSLALAGELQTLGVDLLDCSSGGLVPGAHIPVAPGYQVPFATQIRRETGLPTATVGLITEATQANEIVEEGRADLVLLGRELLRDPRWPLRAAAALSLETPWPGQYARAARSPVSLR